MKRLLKFLVWLSGIALLIVAALLVVLPLVVNPNDFKEDISQAVKDATGRELSFHGDITLSLFPWLGVELGGVSLANAPGFGPEPFAEVGGAVVKVRLLPLLSREVEISTLSLKDLRLNLSRHADGRSNWDDLGGPAAPATAGAKAAVPSAPLPALAALAIGGVAVENAQLRWDDQSTGQHVQLGQFNLKSGAIIPGQPVVVSLSTAFATAAPPRRGRLELAGELDFDLAFTRIKLQQLRLNTQLQGEALPAPEVALVLTGAADLDLETQRHRLHSLSLSTTLTGPELPEGRVTATLAADLDLDLAAETAVVRGLDLNTLGIQAQGRLRAVHILSAPSVTGELTLPPFNARTVLKKLRGEALDTADPQALGAVGARLAFAVDETQARLTALTATLDDSTLTGTAGVSNFAHPAVRFNLKLDGIDADRYLPPPGDSPVAATPAGAGAAGAAALPLETLRALDIEGRLAVGRLKIAKLHLQDIQARLQARDGVLLLQPLGAKLYGGRYQGDLALDVRGDAPVIKMNERLEMVQAGPLTRDLLREELVSGLGDLTVTLSARGLDPDAALRSLNGTAVVNVTQGGIRGLNLAKAIKAEYAPSLQRALGNSGELDQTLFRRLGLTARIKNGVASTGDLTLDSAQLHVLGQGNVNLLTEQVDLRLEATPKGQFEKQMGQFAGIAIPVNVRGTYTELQTTIDLDEALKRAAKARLGRRKQKLEEELKRKAEAEKAKVRARLEAKKAKAKEKLEEELKGKLKGLFP